MDTLYTHYWFIVRGIGRLPVDFDHTMPVMHTLYCLSAGKHLYQDVLKTRFQDVQNANSEDVHKT